MLLVGLVESLPDMRVLFLRAAGPVGVAEIDTDSLLRDASKTFWSRENVRDHEGKPLLPEVHIEWISHTRQPDEVKVLSSLQDWLRQMKSSSPFMHIIARTLLQAASSSLFALEQRLNRMRLPRNKLPFIERDPDFADGSTEEATEADSNAHTWLKSEFVEAANLLRMLDNVETDSKFDRLLELLKTLGLMTSGPPPVCIFTRYVDTAAYLESALGEHLSRVVTLTGNLSFSEQDQIVGAVRARRRHPHRY